MQEEGFLFEAIMNLQRTGIRGFHSEGSMDFGEAPLVLGNLLRIPFETLEAACAIGHERSKEVLHKS
jgi:hypothetical protein